MFHLISEEDYEKGLLELRHDFQSQIKIGYSHGETFLWLRKT